MAEFDFSQDPVVLNKQIGEHEASLAKGNDTLRKVEKRMSERERILFDIAKKRDKIRKAEVMRELEYRASGGNTGFQLGAGSAPTPGRVRGRGLMVQGSYGIEPAYKMDVGGGGNGVGRYTGGGVGGGSAPNPYANAKDAQWGMKPPAPPGGGIGGAIGAGISGIASFMPAVAAFAGAVQMFGHMVVAADATRSKNVDAVGTVKVRSQRAAKSLGLTEQDVAMSVTTATDQEQALRFYETLAAKKRKTGIAPSKTVIAGLASAAQRGGVGWDEVTQAGQDGTWGRYTKSSGLTGDASEINQLNRGKNSAEFDAKAITWNNDRAAAKQSMFSDAEWEAFKANNPTLSNIPGARESRALFNSSGGGQRQMQEAYGDMPTGSGFGGAPPPSMQAPIQQLGVDLRSGGRGPGGGATSVRIENPEAIRPRSQLDVRSGNTPATGN